VSDLRKAAERYISPGAIVPVDINTTRFLVDALRQALAQPESTKWEPAIVHNYNPDGTLQSIKVKLTPQSDWLDYEPLKREWVGLTDDEIWGLGANNKLDVEWANEIEAKLKEKNA
jgi:hypothetical protein